MKKPIIIFVATTLLLATLFFTLPINLFDGEIVMQEPHREYVVEARLSLSYFLGIGFQDVDMEHVKDFYLTPKGIFMAFLFIVGLPALLAYRISLTKTVK